MITFGLFDRPGRLAEPMQRKFGMGEYAVGLLVHAVFGRISEWMGAGTHQFYIWSNLAKFYCMHA